MRENSKTLALSQRFKATMDTIEESATFEKINDYPTMEEVTYRIERLLYISLEASQTAYELAENLEEYLKDGATTRERYAFAEGLSTAYAAIVDGEIDVDESILKSVVDGTYESESIGIGIVEFNEWMDGVVQLWCREEVEIDNLTPSGLPSLKSKIIDHGTKE